MGSNHSTHKRLKSTPSKSYECTEIIDFEFSESVVPPETLNDSDATKVKVNATTNNKDPVETKTMDELIYPPKLLLIINHLKELESSINEMPDADLFIHFPTIKDDLHNCWQKVYDIKETNLDTKLKKTESIETIKSLLKKTNQRFLKRSCNNGTY